MSRRTLALIAVLVVITAFLLVLALKPETPGVPYSTVARPTPPPSVAIQTTLALVPSTLTVPTSSPSASVDVMIDTEENNVTAVQLELSYNPKVLSEVEVATSSGTFFENPVTLLKNIDPVKGTISYAVGIAPTGSPKKGKGTIATISFKAIGSTSQTTSITFSPKTLVTAEGATYSVLKDSVGTRILLK